MIPGTSHDRDAARCSCGACRLGWSRLRRRDGLIHSHYACYPTEHFYDPEAIWPTKLEERAFRGYGR